MDVLSFSSRSQSEGSRIEDYTSIYGNNRFLLEQIPILRSIINLDVPRLNRPEEIPVILQVSLFVDLDQLELALSHL